MSGRLIPSDVDTAPTNDASMVLGLESYELRKIEDCQDRVTEGLRRDGYACARVAGDAPSDY